VPRPSRPRGHVAVPRVHRQGIGLLQTARRPEPRALPRFESVSLVTVHILIVTETALDVSPTGESERPARGRRLRLRQAAVI